ncbi:MAG: NapC/NirT family cytochrome c [Candidatus Nanopelagicales bacterium]|nr:NapC/NirT family cytochrome c [Candidatus Nanopelagicales bacterium]MDZ4250121.1 NapC/NirT family cytochrome c [Candidatus Nanopelagicales bacterium]
MTLPPDQTEDAAEPAARRGWRARIVPRTHRGLLVMLVLAGGLAAVHTFGGIWASEFSETTEFCSTCHAMEPQVKANQAGVHSDVNCGECHITPGIMGLIKAKIGGTRELYLVATDEYPRPIVINRAKLPPVQDTCIACHPLDQVTRADRPLQLILRPTFKPDKANTREMVAVAVNANGGPRGGADTSSGSRGAHWHVDQDIWYLSGDEAQQDIDLVVWTPPGGSTKTYVKASQVDATGKVALNIPSLLEQDLPQKMNCVDCHNRVGHSTPDTGAAVDAAIADGRISGDLPFIKRDSVALLNGRYSSDEVADEAFDGLVKGYATKYPLVAKTRTAQIDAAVAELKVQYRILATPWMDVQARTYPNNLGHQASPGCLRCHDGAHYLVEKGKATAKPIKSSCSTCHTFPQVGPEVSELPLGSKPANHKRALWVFKHKRAASSASPVGTSCGACHSRSYCENCHASGAINISHDDMIYGHAAQIRKSGVQSCALCHKPSYCATCHAGDVLPTSSLSPGLPQASARSP